MQLGGIAEGIDETMRQDWLRNGGFFLSHVRRLSVAQFTEQAKNFEIQPDERDHQAERAVPLHVLRRSAGYACLDHIEIENQIERRNDDHEEAEADSDDAASIDRRDRNVEE